MDAAVFRVTEGKSREGEGMDTPGRGAETRKDSPCSVQELAILEAVVGHHCRTCSGEEDCPHSRIAQDD